MPVLYPGSKALPKSKLQPAIKVLPVSLLTQPLWAPRAEKGLYSLRLSLEWVSAHPQHQGWSTQLQRPQNVLPELLENSSKLSDHWAHICSVVL